MNTSDAMNNAEQILISFLSNKMNIVELQHCIVENASLESLLDTESAEPSTSSTGSLLYLILEANPRSPQDVLAVRKALEQYAVKLGLDTPTIPSKIDTTEQVIRTALQPWLSLSQEYLIDLINAMGPLPLDRFEEEVRHKVAREFKCLQYAPRWLTNCNWPMAHGEPSIFLGQLNVREGSFDNCEIYVFWHESEDRYEVIRQRA